MDPARPPLLRAGGGAGGADEGGAGKGRAGCEALAAWLAASVVEGGADASGYVWPGTTGGGDRPMHDRSAHRALERACHRAGLEDPPARPGGRPRRFVTLHGLRHTAASLMLAGGVPLTVVAAQLGHADPAITARIYAHLVSGRDLDLAAAVFERPEATTISGEGLGGEDA